MTIILPEIKFVANSLETEQGLFLRYLDHPKYPSHRNYILTAFPELQAEIAGNSNLTDAVNKFLSAFYVRWAKEIKHIIQSDRELIEQDGSAALRALAETMDYLWPEPVIYSAIPTILPFSPFNDLTFFFSILGRLKRRPGDNVIVVAVHEISHFIFLNQLSKMPQRLNLSSTAIHLVKEVLTAALLNMSPIRETLHINSYKGNPETQELYIIQLDGQSTLFVQYLCERYAVYRQNKPGWFNNFIQELITLVHAHNTEFCEKATLWNELGRTTGAARSALLTQYREPIRI